MIWLAALLGIIAQAAIDPPEPAILLTVPASHRLIEGIATDGETVWLSSVVDRRILVWRRGKPIRSIAMPSGTARPIGLAYDAMRQWIWIATDCPKIAAEGVCDKGALIAIDRIGRLKARLAPADRDAHFGDVSVASGVVHVGDSSNGSVYRCRDACTALETVIPPGVNRSAQSTASYGDGRLLVADYSVGIVSVDSAGNQTPILREDERPLRGVDGLARAVDWFIGVQNSQSPGIVLAFRLAPDGKHMTNLHVLGGESGFPEPTQIVVAGDSIYVVVDAQWAAYDPAGTAPRPAQRATPILILPVPVNAP
ncbi:hypothetical protein ACVWZA_001560 [Sphingomonas sp. UYAg733]